MFRILKRVEMTLSIIRPIIKAWGVGIGNKAQLRPAKAGAVALPELGNIEGNDPVTEKRARGL